MIIFPAYITKIETLKDRSGKITLCTQELNKDKAAEIFSLQSAMGYVGFKIDPFSSEEKNIMKELESGYDMPSEKSPSKRLRNVLYLNWKKKPKGYEDFALFYNNEYETIINHYKSKLD